MRVTLLYYDKDDAGTYIESQPVDVETYEDAESIGRRKYGGNFIEVEEKAEEVGRTKLKEAYKAKGYL